MGVNTRMLAVFVGLLAIGLIGSAQASRDGEKERIVKVVETYQRALNGNDVEGVLKVYADDGVFMPEFSPASVGLAEVREAYERVFKAIDLNVGLHIVEVTVLSDDWALVRSTSDGKIKINASGAQVTNDSKELFVLQRQDDGEWRFARYAFSSNVRPQ